jgi:hypothetical protein
MDQSRVVSIAATPRRLRQFWAHRIGPIRAAMAPRRQHAGDAVRPRALIPRRCRRQHYEPLAALPQKRRSPLEHPGQTPPGSVRQHRHWPAEYLGKLLADLVVLSDVDRNALTRRVRGYTERFSVVVRARIVPLAAQQMTNVAIAGRLDLDVDTVGKWRKRFVTEGIDGLRDRKRSGRPRRFAAEVKAMACEPPSARAVPLSRWSS